MNKETNKLIPQLRFPEFVNEGEWEKKCLEELFEIGNGRDYKHLGKGEIPVYGSGGYMLSVDDYLYDGESVCIGRKGTIDKPMFLKGKFWTVDTLFYTHSFKDCIPKYIHYVFQNIDWLKHNEAGGVPSLSKTNIYKIEVLVPKPLEQQKIASCLSSLDELIAAHSQKLEALKEHKKGLMQNLFPQEGERVPKWRFKEFEGDGEWVEKMLHEVAVIGRGKSKHRPRDAQFLLGGKYPFIQTGDIKKAGLYLSEFSQTYSEEGLKQSKLWNENTLCITIAANIAETSILKIKACFPDSIIGLVTDENKTNIVFVKYSFDVFKERIQSLSQGVAQDNLNQEKLSKIEFAFPSVIEQQKIASCLSSLDALIAAQTEKVEQLKLHKKGLMQGLFVGV